MEPAHGKFDQLRARLHEIESKVKDAANKAVSRESLGAPSQRLRSTPDWVRRTIRLSMCLLILGALGHSDYGNAAFSGELMKSANWAAITCIVVTAPLIGQVAEVSVYRIVGTLLGGFLGFAVWSFGSLFSEHAASFCVVGMSPFVVLPTVYLAFKHQADQLSKFVQLTYVIVGYNAKRSKSAAMLAVLRVSGIIGGGLLSLVLAVIVLPRSATVESCRELKKAMKALADLNRAVWAASSTPLPAQDNTKKKKLGVLDNLNRMSLMGPFVSSTTAGQGLHRTRPRSLQDVTTVSAAALQDIMMSRGHQQEIEVEKLFNAVHSSLARVEDMLGKCKGEIYIGQLYGNFIFLPSWLPSQIYGIKFRQLGSWHLPYDDVMMLLTILRRVARLLWSLFLDIEEGFDDTMQEVLAQYPKALMSEVALYVNKTLLDLYAAFPNNSFIEIDNLMNLGQVVDCLITLSDARHRDAVFSMRSKRKTTRPAFSAFLSPDVLPDASTHGARDSMTDTPADTAATRAGSSGMRRQSDASTSSPLFNTLAGPIMNLAALRSGGGGGGGGGGTGGGAAAAGGGGTGSLARAPSLFASRALCEQPGQLSLLELPPRRLLQASSLRRSLDVTAGGGPDNDARTSSGTDCLNDDELNQSQKLSLLGMQGSLKRTPRPSRPMLPTIPSELDMSSLIPAVPQTAHMSPFGDPANAKYAEQAWGVRQARASGERGGTSGLSNLGRVQSPGQPSELGSSTPGQQKQQQQGHVVHFVQSAVATAGSGLQGGVTQQDVINEELDADVIDSHESETQPLLVSTKSCSSPSRLTQQPGRGAASSKGSSSSGDSSGSTTSGRSDADLERVPLLGNSHLVAEPSQGAAQQQLQADDSERSSTAQDSCEPPTCLTPRASQTSQAGGSSSSSAGQPRAVLDPTPKTAATRMSVCSSTSDTSDHVCRTPRASWEGDLDGMSSGKVLGEAAAQLAGDQQPATGGVLFSRPSHAHHKVLPQPHATIKQLQQLHQARAQGVAPSLLSERLEMLLASCTIEPIVFPANEQGWAAQVRWHSLQWLLNELVEELEEAFLGVSTIMGRLPHPIK